MEPQLARILDEIVQSLEALWAEHRSARADFLADHIILTHVLAQIIQTAEEPQELLDRIRVDARRMLLYAPLMDTKEPNESTRRDALARQEAFFDQIANALGLDIR